MLAGRPGGGRGVVVAVAYVDPGNFATNTEAGASLGVRLLWVVVLRPQGRRRFEAAVAALFAAGIVGATVMPHAIYVHSSLASSHRIPLRTHRIDIVLVCALNVAVISALFTG